MSHVERSCTIAADPAAVWGVLADYAGISAWAPDVGHSCLLTEGGAGPGVRRRVQVGRSTLVETVLVWEPPTTLSYSLEGLPRVVRSVVNTWHVRPHAGGTSVVLTSDVDTGSRPLQKLVARIVGHRLAAASDGMLAGLTAYIQATEKAA